MARKQVRGEAVAADAEQRLASVDVLAVSVPEAARLLGLSRPTMWRLVWSGEVPSIKIGAARRVPMSALKQLVGA